MRSAEKLSGFANMMLRIISVLFVLGCQVTLLIAGMLMLRRSAVDVYLLMQLISVPVIYVLVNKEAHYKLNWVLIIFLLPGCGFILYFLWGSKREFNWFNRRFRRAENEICEDLMLSAEAERACCKNFPNEAPISRYLARRGYPAYENVDTRFFPCGAEMYKSLLPDLKAAKESIYIEMFILDRGTIWDELFAVLKEKAAAGLDVRLLLDDFGSLRSSTPRFRRTVREAGIRLAFFAPINKDILHASFNFRTHQKYILIDHQIGYSGGINLADEYFDRKERFGYWKDTATRIRGSAVHSMEAMFLVMWQVCTGESQRLPPEIPQEEGDGAAFVRPFDGGPAKNPDNPVAVLYDMVMHRAVKYLYITTPYLVLDQEMFKGLIQAAKSGVDVRIMMPGIYDKWYVRAVSYHNIGPLLRNGIRVFEYEPGFLHAKMLVADGTCAICGSVNLDFRSLWEHYECGAFFTGGTVVQEIEEDIRSIKRQSREISYEQWKHRGILRKIIEEVLCLLAPLM